MNILQTTLKIIIVAVIIKPETLKFYPDHLRTRKCVNMQLNNYLLK